MKILFCVFSGTGNTLKVASELGGRLVSLNNQVEIIKVKRGVKSPDVSEYDAVVFGYPVHAFNAPAVMLKFLKKLPKTDGKAAYLLRCSGEPLALNEASVVTPRRILKRRGYNVSGAFMYVMPYNIIFRHTDEMASRMWRSACELTGRYAEQINALQCTHTRVGPIKRAVSFTLRIEHLAMPVIGRTFRANKHKCVGCGACVSVCPMNNITIKNGLPKFGFKCVGCMACAFNCPKDAVRTSLLNSWRVNGKYEFGGEPATDDEVCSYCKKSYLRYFHDSESPQIDENNKQ